VDMLILLETNSVLNVVSNCKLKTQICWIAKHWLFVSEVSLGSCQ